MYWNYWTKEKESYLKMLDKHKEFSKNISIASGIGTWGVLTYFTEGFTATKAAIDAAKEAKLDTIIFTMWLDDGAYCNFYTALIGMYNTSEYLFYKNDETADKSSFKKLFNIKYEDILKASAISTLPMDSVKILWDDPIYSIYMKSMNYHSNKNIISETIKILKKLEEDFDNIEDKSNLICHSKLISKLLRIKLELFLEVQERKENRVELAKLQNKISEIADLYLSLEKSFRTFWMKNYKPFGFEVLQNRMFALFGRYKELALRIEELQSKKNLRIEELFEDSGSYHEIPNSYNKISLSSISRF